MISWTEIIVRLTLAGLFGAAIGLERERKDWAAGLRTHMMVCVGASLTMMVSAYGFSEVIGGENIVLDPSRIAAQVISGIGFIGAGTILFLKQGIIRGLTTASGLWTVAAIGLATGGGMYFAAAVATILAIIILWILQPIEKKFSSRFVQKSISIVIANQDSSVNIIKELLGNKSIEISNCQIEKNANEFLVSIRFKNVNREELSNIINDIQSRDSVKQVNWNN